METLKNSKYYVLNSSWSCLSRSSFLLPPVDKHVFKGINCATNTLWYQALIVSCFISRQFPIRAYIRDLAWYCFVFLPTHPPALGDFAWSKSKTRLHAILQPRGAGVLLHLQLIKEFEQRRPKLTSRDERLILGHICIYSWKRHALCYAVFGFARNRWLNTLYGIVWETKYGRFTTLNIPKCEHFTLLVCPLRFLVISAMRRLGNVQSFKT